MKDNRIEPNYSAQVQTKINPLGGEVVPDTKSQTQAFSPTQNQNESLFQAEHFRPKSCSLLKICNTLGINHSMATKRA